eukprot:m.179905 g.179905  ORF g.179905 m.179905 type:complete len:312 (+) comp18401_c0_seq9:211-1146(+)
MATDTPIEFFDSHFHIWDLKEDAGSGHDPTILFAPNDNPRYDLEKYKADLSQLPNNFVHIGGVFVEAMSVCFPETPGTDEKFLAACATEAEWVHKEIDGDTNNYMLCPSVVLEDPNVATVLDQLIARYPNFCGVRQICNFEPSWPRNKQALGNPLINQQWIAGFRLLAQRKLSFDAQLNPSQFVQLAEIMESTPDMTVIIDHCGSPILTDITEKKDVYFSGLERLAKFPNVYMKISMICYTDAKFDESEVVHSALQRVISIFGYHCHTRVILNRTFSRQEGHVRDTTQKPQPVSLKLDNTSQSVSYKISFK